MILEELNPVLSLMKISGFFVYPKRNKTRITRYFLTFYVFIFIGINFAFCVNNARGMQMCAAHFGLMHHQTFSLLIQALKPLHTFVNLMVFFYNRLLLDKIKSLLLDIDDHFNRSFEYKIRIKYKYFEILSLVAIVFFVPFGIRLSLYLLKNDKLGENWLSDVSLIIVPMFSLWQMLPLYFFYSTTSILCRWFDYLNNQLETNIVHVSLHRDTNSDIAVSLKDYVAIWKKLTAAVFLLGTYFNHFIFFSIFITLSVLCSTLHYLSDVKDLFHTAKSVPYEARIGKYYTLIWTGVQVLAAIAYLLVFCCSGWKTNEASRRIAPLMLSLFPSSMEVKYLVRFLDCRERNFLRVINIHYRLTKLCTESLLNSIGEFPYGEFPSLNVVFS